MNELLALLTESEADALREAQYRVNRARVAVAETTAALHALLVDLAHEHKIAIALEPSQAPAPAPPKPLQHPALQQVK